MQVHTPSNSLSSRTREGESGGASTAANASTTTSTSSDQQQENWESLEGPEAYDPAKPNDYMEYCEQVRTYGDDFGLKQGCTVVVHARMLMLARHTCQM